MEHLSFGTDGIRGPADRFPFTNDPLTRLAQAIGLWAKEKYGTHAKILIGRDTRASGPRMLSAIAQGLTKAHVPAIDAGILPTPAVFALMHHYKTIPVGIVISASHNPAADNGIKMFDLKQGKLSSQDEARICQLYEQHQISFDPNFIPTKDTNNQSYAADYIDIVTKQFPKDMLVGKKIVLDCGHGATYKVAPEIFKRLGAKVHALSITPDGYNINKECGALHLDLLSDTVVKTEAYAGFAFDGDGDRIIAVNKDGEIRDGDDILALLSSHEAYNNQPSVVATIMSNHGLEKHLHDASKTLVRTPVGDKHVAAYMAKHDLLVGGEISGHIILGDHVCSGDGIFAAVRIAQHMIQKHNDTMSSFEKYPQVLQNVPVTRKHDLSEDPYARTIQRHKDMLIDGRIIARYSGTENLLRLMVEDQTIDSAQKILKSLAQNLSLDLA